MQNCSKSIENYCLKRKDLVGFRGASPTDPPPGALPPGPSLRALPQTPVIGSRSRVRRVYIILKILRIGPEPPQMGFFLYACAAVDKISTDVAQRVARSLCDNWACCWWLISIAWWWIFAIECMMLHLNSLRRKDSSLCLMLEYVAQLILFFNRLWYWYQ